MWTNKEKDALDKAMNGKPKWCYMGFFFLGWGDLTIVNRQPTSLLVTFTQTKLVFTNMGNAVAVSVGLLGLVLHMDWIFNGYGFDFKIKGI